jgi:DnaJ-class molecular chaperone
MKTCAYEILGIPKNACDSDIKKAYRTLAVKCHPDKNPDNKQAEEEFKKISEAYSVLTDPEKKVAYDNHGWEAFSNNAQRSPNTPFGFPGNPIFNMFFNNHNQNKKVQKPMPISESITISFEELYCGFNRDVIVNKKVVCKNCYGTGCQSKKSSVCPGCNGVGMKIEIRQMGLFTQHLQIQCNMCNGTGEVIDINDVCKECNGNKLVMKNVVENINTNGSFPTGYKNLLNNKGNELPTGITGDLFIEINVAPKKNWKRESSTSLNIIHRLETTLKDHYFDDYIYINNLDGSVLRLSKKNIDPNVNIFIIPKMGLKDFNNLNIVGNLIILIDIILPKKIEDVNNDNSSIPNKENNNYIDIEIITEVNTICNKYFQLYDIEKIVHNNTQNNEEKTECVQQ